MKKWYDATELQYDFGKFPMFWQRMKNWEYFAEVNKKYQKKLASGGGGASPAPQQQAAGQEDGDTHAQQSFEEQAAAAAAAEAAAAAAEYDKFHAQFQQQAAPEEATTDEAEQAAPEAPTADEADAASTVPGMAPPPAVPTQMPPPPIDEITDGWLFKKGAGKGVMARKNWKKRFCRLEELQEAWYIEWYAKKGDGDPKGAFGLDRCDVEIVENKNHQEAFCFDIYNIDSGKRMQFYATSEAERSGWLVALSARCTVSGERSSAVHTHTHTPTHVIMSSN
jgi:hypothetical protein